MNSTNAQAIRQARADRTRMFRRRIIAGAVALFIATWVVIGAVLVSGHDPALAAHVSTTASSPSTSSSASPSASSSSNDSQGSTSAATGSGSTASSSSDNSTSSGSGSVTTHQS